ncbi:retrovirus-related pol polyprotein from transposon TNT 1-94 [Tanacetum coccineum]|uniref:Retrovirus-related pol polyprotein from transposon TNT 1-94 n=1 Tax=Tanacetum coccineum TaxID=301880 RepID=A0ABQ5BJA6_9ASTR
MKAMKDKDVLQKIVDSWFASSKNLWKLVDCGMSSTVKMGLGYGIKSNAEVLGYEEEISRGIFAFRERDAGNYQIPLYSRFKQVEYKGVPHPLSGDYTPREQEDIDDSLYEYGKHGPQPKTPSPTVSNASSIVFSICPSHDSDGELGTVFNANPTIYSSCQSNDSDGEQGPISDHSVQDNPTNIPSIEQVTKDTQTTQPQVPEPQQTVDPSCAQHVKTPRQPIRTPVSPSPIPSYNRQNWNQRMERELGAGYSFERKSCFVCGSLSHLIKDCDYYEKKMAKEAAFKSTRVIHADIRQATPAWTNSNRVNKANQFTPRPVQLNNFKPKFSTASRVIKTGRVNVNTGKQNVSSGSLHVSSGTHIKSGTSRVNAGKQNVNSGSIYVNSVDEQGTVTGNMSHLEDYQRLNKVGSVTFGGIKSISAISDKKLNVLLYRKRDVLWWTSDVNLPVRKIQIENQLNQKVKIIRSDNGTEFKNRGMLEFCGEKGIKQEFSNARTPQQNGVAERMNRTLIEAARTMLADSLLPTTFWAEAVKYSFAILQQGLGESYAGRNVQIQDSTSIGFGLSLPNGAKVIGNPKTSPLNAARGSSISQRAKPNLGLTIVATSTTEAEYVAAANCCGQVLWVQNQLYYLVFEKSDARSTWAWKRKCQVSLEIGCNLVVQPQSSSDPTPSQSVQLLIPLNTNTPTPPTKVNAAEVNTGEVNAAEVNTGEAERVQRRKEEPMTEETSS